MIRAKPTAIELGLSDIRDYDRRRRQHDIKPDSIPHIISHQSQFDLPIRIIGSAQICDSSINAIPSTDGSHLANRTNSQSSLSPGINSLTSRLANLEAKLAELTKDDTQSDLSSDSIYSDDEPHDGFSLMAEASELRSDDEDVENEHEHNNFEEITVGRSGSPSKDDFHYGGFVESPSQTDSNKARQSSPFDPDEVSTPPRLQPPPATTQRLPTRGKLPRSPLFLAQNASSSPERRPTASLTPRVVSRIATHNTPGIMFAQPARRPGTTDTRQPRTLRHQTNSFSFDESERSSVAYEQERVSSSSTTDSRPRPSGNLNLRQELRGSSLESSRVPSFADSFQSVTDNDSTLGVPSHSDAYNHGHGDEVDQFPEDDLSDPGSPTIEQILAEGETSDAGSPQLPLPPPFSTVARSVSRAGSLPSSPPSEFQDNFPDTSSIRSPSESPERRATAPELSSPASQHIRGHDGIPASSPPSSSHRKRHNIVQAAVRIMSGYRTRAPVHRSSPARASPPSSPSPQRQTARPTPRRESGPAPRVYTPSRPYAVYNDYLPASSQPQTPAHLPEARHQSRYHPSYTAPTTRSMARNRSRVISGGPQTRLMAIGTPGRALDLDGSEGEMRSGSPIGLLEEGFRGLYGGRENGDEERSWIEGVRARNAEMRNWLVRDIEEGAGRGLEDEE